MNRHAVRVPSSLAAPLLACGTLAQGVGRFCCVAFVAQAKSIFDD